MRKDNNNNNNKDLISFNVDSFSPADFKSIILKSNYFNSDRRNGNLIEPWLIQILDCNRVEIGLISFHIPYNNNCTEKAWEFKAEINSIYNTIIFICELCLEGSSQIIYSNEFYMHINKLENII